MKKMMMTVALLLALAGAAFALAQESAQETGTDAQAEAMEQTAEPELLVLYGTITEITDECILLDTPELGEVQANLSEDTLLEGVDALEIGQVAMVVYDGRMTRSLPPQITALRIGVYAVEGVVTQVLEDRITVMSADEQEVILTLPQEDGETVLAVGDEIIAYTNGISTMSLPPQMNAIAIVLPAQEATPSEATPAEATPAEAGFAVG